jgi:hypothetical protein
MAAAPVAMTELLGSRVVFIPVAAITCKVERLQDDVRM